MKVERVNNEISKSENFEQKTFSIKVCAKAFDIFSSKLYSDIHMAIIRELSANAWDSHCQAGKEKVPFHVHLPNTLEPFFSIRDFGTGLSHEDVMTLYTTYFESTKTETNDQVGSFGLGSKSPYAYTDNFTVTSFFNGKKTIYSMFKGEEGFPVVAVLNQTETEEDNGLEILMASKTKDIDIFLKKAAFIYNHFPVYPVISGNSYQRPNQNFLLHGTDWKLFSKGEPGIENVLIMGCIAYPIQLDFFEREIRDFLYSARLQLQIPIGSVQVSANREEIHYDDKTIESIQTKIKTVISEVKDKFIKEINKKESLYEARSYVYDLAGYYYSPLSSLKFKDLFWKDNPAQQVYPTTEIPIPDSVKVTTAYTSKTRAGNDRFHTYKSYSVSFNRKRLFIIDDLNEVEERHLKARVLPYLKILGTDPQVEIIIDSNHEETDKFLQNIGLEREGLIKLSSLPIPPKSPRKKRTPSSSPRKKYYDGFEIQNESFVEKPIDPTEESIYIVYNRGKLSYVDEPREINTFEINKVINCGKDWGVQIPHIVAIKKGFVSRIIEKTHWTDFKDYFRKSITKVLNENPDLLERLEYRIASDDLDFFYKMRKLGQAGSPIFDEMMNKIDSLSSDPIIGRLNMVHDYQITFILESFLKTKDESIQKKKKMLTSFTERYPLLNHVNHHDIRIYDDFRQYIKLMDKELGEFECKTKLVS